MIILPSACFTGHRPPRFNSSAEPFVREKLTETVNSLIGEGYDCFISGMAMGVDLLAAEIVLEIKASHPGIKLECALPCRGQTSRWNAADKKRHASILEKADKITYVSERFSPFCMQLRNAYMVDSSDTVIAVYDGGEGGTANTVSYAKRRNKRLVLIPCGGDGND